MKKLPTSHPHSKALRSLREFGLTFPDAATASPWPEHDDLVVRKKTFAFLAADGQPFSISCKLAGESHREALTFPFAQPTPYGLGKSGWVSAKFSVLEKPPVELFKRWIDESYRARAPKTLVKQLDGATSSAPRASAARRSRPRSSRR